MSPILDEQGNLPPAEREKMLQQLLAPAAYAHSAENVRHIETHISDLFLSGDFVYKIKKPVDLSFVNFVRLADRERFVRIELEINRPLTAGVYLGVSEVRRSGQGVYSIDGPGDTVDFALRMRRLPSEDTLEERLETGNVSSEQIVQVAETVTRFHEDAAVCERDVQVLLDRIRRMTEQNFDTVARHPGVAEGDALSEIRAYTRGFLKARRERFAVRVAQGRVRDGHGDLHAGNIFFCPQLQIIDRIEFDAALRCTDVAADIAFLAMDLEHRGRADLATLFFDTYRSRSHDDGVAPFLNFYKTYRAMVRAKVTSLRHEQGAVGLEEATSYRTLASGYVDAERPKVLILVSGLSGTGKSTLARALAQRWRAERHSSDVIRKGLAGLALDAPISQEQVGTLYSHEMSQRTYAALLSTGEQGLASGSAVVLDATFSMRESRIEAREIAHRRGAKCVLLECVLDERTQRARLAQRTRPEAEGSDATANLIPQQRASWAVVQPRDADAVVKLETLGALAATVEAASTAIWEAVLQATVTS